MYYWNDIKQGIMNFIRRNKHYALSFTWLVLIILFTYTSLVYFALQVMDTSLVNEYCKDQQCGISLLVNLGLLSMVIFDYIGAGKIVTNKMLLIILAAVFLIFGIYLHAGVFMSDKLTKYVYPISNTYFSMVLHIIFFIILFYIKVKSIEECDTDIVAQEEY